LDFVFFNKGSAIRVEIGIRIAKSVCVVYQIKSELLFWVWVFNFSYGTGLPASGMD
jgi:hypothetical protein